MSGERVSSPPSLREALLRYGMRLALDAWIRLASRLSPSRISRADLQLCADILRWCELEEPEERRVVH